jgi:myo-inositol-1(or 4)-monophosphatase
MVLPSLSPEMLDRARATAFAAARAGAAVLADGYPRVKDVRFKKGNPADIVTEFDVQAERAVLDVIRRAFPDHGILAEESGASKGSTEFTWLVDPLDGTTNFAQAIPAFCVSIALIHGDEPVLGVIVDPTRDETFYAERGKGATLNGSPIQVSGKQRLREAVVSVDGGPGWFPPPRRLRVPRTRLRAPRMAGSAALDLAYVACGRLDLLYNRGGLSPWDFGAGAILISEAGGRVTDWDRPLSFRRKSALLAGPPALHARFLSLAQQQSAWPWQRAWRTLMALPAPLKALLSVAALSFVTWRSAGWAGDWPLAPTVWRLLPHRRLGPAWPARRLRGAARSRRM